MGWLLLELVASMAVAGVFGYLLALESYTKLNARDGSKRSRSEIGARARNFGIRLAIIAGVLAVVAYRSA